MGNILNSSSNILNSSSNIYTYNGDDIPEKTKRYITVIIVSSSISNIKATAFMNCKQLKNIQLPENLSSIGASAFYECVNLKNITLPKNVKKIEQGTFDQCVSLIEITLYDIEQIEDNAFSGCRNLEIMITGNRITKFKNKNKDSIKGHIILPKNLSIIGKYAFYNCLGFKTLVMDPNVERFSSIGASAFENCENLVSIQLSKNLETIGASAFKNCKKLKIIKLPENVKKIEDETFAYCENLKTISLENIESIGDHVFPGFPTDLFIIVSGKLKSIGEFPFGEDSFVAPADRKKINIYIKTEITNHGDSQRIKNLFNESQTIPLITQEGGNELTVEFIFVDKISTDDMIYHMKLLDKLDIGHQGMDVMAFLTKKDSIPRKILALTDGKLKRRKSVRKSARKSARKSTRKSYKMVSKHF